MLEKLIEYKLFIFLAHEMKVRICPNFARGKIKNTTTKVTPRSNRRLSIELNISSDGR